MEKNIFFLLKRMAKERVPQKSLGQHFLFNLEILNKILREAQVSSKDYILEIGPGFGFLTIKLLQKAKKVLVVEIDPTLIEKLKEIFSGLGLKIIQGDILKISNQKIFQELVGGRGEYKIVSNLPFNLASEIILKFLKEEPKPKEMVVMVQKEIAKRIVNLNKENLLSLWIKFFAHPQILFYISKAHFWPKPRVDAALIKVSKILSSRKVKRRGLDFNFFQKITQGGFQQKRRKLISTLRKNLRISNKDLLEIFKNLKIHPQIRPENLSFEKWLSLGLELTKIRSRLK